MVACTFFGHKMIIEDIEDDLKKVIEYLIYSKGVDTFFVGNQGAFDEIVLRVLLELKGKHIQIDYAVVIAYHPDRYEKLDFNSLYPEELENVHPRFAIDRRNRWMIERSKYAVAYVKHSGGAERYFDIAKRKGLEVYNIAEKLKEVERPLFLMQNAELRVINNNLAEQGFPLRGSCQRS